MSLTRRLSHALDRRALTVDAVVTGVISLLMLPVFIGQSSFGGGASRPVFLLGSLGMVLLAAASVFRRRRTDPAVWAGLTGAVLLIPVGIDAVFTLAAAPFVVLVAHSAASLGSRRVRRAAFIGIVAGAVLLSLLRFSVWTEAHPAAIIVLGFSTLAVGLSGWALGDVARARRQALRSAEERALRLEREAAQERRLAAQDERARIAREMHDIVAHSLAVIVTQADGGRYAAQADPAAGPRTLEVIAGTARESLAQMRSLLGVLRSDGEAEHSAAPDLDSLDELVRTSREQGVDAAITVSGEPRRNELPPGAELVLYRAAQEIVTNAVRHAGPRPAVLLELAWERGRVRLTGRSRSLGGEGAPAVPPIGEGSRLGLRGMAERVSLYGGRLRAGPTSTGFRVDAVLPCTPDTAPVSASASAPAARKAAL